MPPAQIIRSEAALPLALLAATVATRWMFWGVETIDWDEATFALAGQDVLAGHLPYTNTFDVKPPGLFLAIAGVFAVFGQSLLALRLLGAALVFGGAVLTAAAARPWGRDRAVIGGGLYVLACGAPFAQHTGTELLAAFFVAGALCAWTRCRGATARAALVGLCLSLAVLTRSNLVFLPLAFGTILATEAVRARRAAPLAAFAAAGLAPLAALFAVYAAHGKTDVLMLSLVTVPLRYSGGGAGPLLAFAEQVLHVIGWSARRPLSVLALTVLTAAAIRQYAQGRAPDARAAVVAFASTALSIVVSGEAYSHYLTQLVPAAALLAAIGLPPGWARGAIRWIAGAGAGLCALGALNAAFGPPPERPLRDIAAIIAAEGSPSDAVFPATGHLVLFHLRRPTITPVLHPSNVARDSVARGLAEAGYAVDPLGRSIAAAPAWVVAPPDGAPKYLNGAQAERFAGFLACYDRRAVRGEYALYRRGACPAQ